MGYARYGNETYTSQARAFYNHATPKKILKYILKKII